MFTNRDIAIGVLLPLAVSSIVMGVVWCMRRRESRWDGGGWGSTIALGGSFLAAYPAILQRIPFPPFEATDWLYLVVIAATVLGLVDGLCVVTSLVRRTIGCVALVVMVWLLLRLLPSETLGTSARAGWVAAIGLVVGAWWVCLDVFGYNRDGPALPASLLVTSGAASLVLLMSGSKLLGQLGGVLAVALLPILVVAWRVPAVSLSRGGAFTLVTVIAGLLVCGHFYAYLGLTNAVLLLSAGLLAAVGNAKPFLLIEGWKRVVAQQAIVIAPAAVAVGLAAAEFAASPY